MYQTWRQSHNIEAEDLSKFYYFQFNSLQPRVAFLYPPENIRKPKGFLTFSGGIEKQHQAVMG